MWDGHGEGERETNGLRLALMRFIITFYAFRWIRFRLVFVFVGGLLIRVKSQ
ncbi:hypothetical protein IE53DRAFT_216214 [Violaceomyces palustris]|uniref:Uncharacterized protein n=1 Tax=Violaceomyces palustris TaxID=1673888 RepID=A0ACD0P8L1_9BASI|nr:hypothetical protein IE53DRAFT_216214 [Violaceomyces palustris]